MPSCITSDYKSVLTNLMVQNAEYAIVKGLIDSMPLCEQVMPTTGAIEEAKKRSLPEPWGIEPMYYPEKGKKQKFSSPSALVKELGLPMSGIQCDLEGKKCRVTSAVEILQVHGYTVTGDGEPKKAGEGGTVLNVFHPKSPALKKAAEAAEKEE